MTRYNIDEFAFEIGDCLTRECISPIVIRYKLAMLNFDSPPSILGDWEMITSLMTWKDSVLDQNMCTILLDECPVKIQFIYRFNSDNTGTSEMGDQVGRNFKWRIEDNNHLIIQSKEGKEESFVFRSNEKFLEKIHVIHEKKQFYGYEVYRKLKE